MNALRALVRTVVAGLVLTTVVAGADELGDAMARADALAFAGRIALQQDQARAMVAPLERVQALVAQHESAGQQRLNALAPTLTRARTLLTAGQELPADIQSALLTYRQQGEQAQLALYRGVNQEMGTIKGLMYLEQNALLDWTPPAAVGAGEDLQERLRVQQVANGRIEEAGRMLQSVKYLDAFNFVTARTPMISDYLARYFDPNQPNWETAYRIALGQTDRVRMLTEEEWQATSWDLAAELVDRLGLMPAQAGGPQPGAVTWGTLYRLFTSPQTLEVVQGLGRG